MVLAVRYVVVLVFTIPNCFSPGALWHSSMRNLRASGFPCPVLQYFTQGCTLFAFLGELHAQDRCVGAKLMLSVTTCCGQHTNLPMYLDNWSCETRAGLGTRPAGRAAQDAFVGVAVGVLVLSDRRELCAGEAGVRSACRALFAASCSVIGKSGLMEIIFPL